MFGGSCLPDLVIPKIDTKHTGGIFFCLEDENIWFIQILVL
jgi:hypothetical protein